MRAETQRYLIFVTLLCILCLLWCSFFGILGIWTRLDKLINLCSPPQQTIEQQDLNIEDLETGPPLLMEG